MNKYKLIFPFLILCCTTACYYDNEENLFPKINSDCNLENIRFSVEITNTLTNYCYKCHSNSNAAAFGANIKLEDYTDVVNQFDNISGSVKHEPSYSPMPKGGGKIPDCELKQLEAWNSDGKTDN